MRPIYVFSCLYSIIHLCRGMCGFPGHPKFGNFTMNGDQPVTIDYYCNSLSFVDGDVQRVCQLDGKWSGRIPRCALDVSDTATFSSTSNGTSFTDKNFETCDFVEEGDSLVLVYDEVIYIRRLMLLFESNNPLEITDWSLEMTGGDQAGNYENGDTIQNETSFGDRFSGLQWHLNDTARVINVTLLKGNVDICEVLVHSIPNECGPPEDLDKGQVQWSGMEALYLCKAGYLLSTESSTRTCSHGRWSGDQPICQVISDCSVWIGLFCTAWALGVVYISIRYVAVKCTQRNFGSSNIPIIFWTCVCITQIKVAHCGFPDQPINGKVVVTSEGETLVAKYECPQSFAIDGDLRRTCSEGRWSGIPPRCADEKEKKTNCKISHVGEWSTFSFPKKIHLARVTITSPVNYIDLFRDAEWRLSLFLENTTVANKSNGIFHETETSLANDHFASIQWHLNDTADSISLKHEKGITYACETIVYAFSDECGDPEMLINGIVSVAGNTATYACRPGFSSPQASRECVMGRWIGEIPECRLPTHCSTADHQADSVYLPWLIAGINSSSLFRNKEGSATRLPCYEELKWKGPIR